MPLYIPDAEEVEAMRPPKPTRGMLVVSMDADINSSDWAKRTWDLPPYKSPEFMAMFPDLDAFRHTKHYQNAVEQGLILDDEWVADHVESAE